MDVPLGRGYLLLSPMLNHMADCRIVQDVHFLLHQLGYLIFPALTMEGACTSCPIQARELIQGNWKVPFHNNLYGQNWWNHLNFLLLPVYTWNAFLWEHSLNPGTSYVQTNVLFRFSPSFHCRSLLYTIY